MGAKGLMSVTNDVAAPNIQAATSRASRIGLAKKSLGTLQAAARGRGDAEAARFRVFEWQPAYASRLKPVSMGFDAQSQAIERLHFHAVVISKARF
jgi:hypothetical protein